MKSEIQINNTAGACHIDIEGTIGVPEAWQFEQVEERVATYEAFRKAVQRIGTIDSAEVVVNIRSTGGDVNDALLIHDALLQTGAHITTRCYGYTASAATVIAQAASEGCREISANALYLIHTSVCATEGNAAELTLKTDLLRQTDARLAALYAARSGRDAAEYSALMAENNGNGRWLSPDEAVAAGLADRVVDAGSAERSSGTGVSDRDGGAGVSDPDVDAGVSDPDVDAGVSDPDVDAAQMPAQSLPQSIVRGWRRLLAAVGIPVEAGLRAGKEARPAVGDSQPYGKPRQGGKLEPAEELRQGEKLEPAEEMRQGRKLEPVEGPACGAEAQPVGVLRQGRAWRRAGELRAAPGLPEDRNILHFEADNQELQRLSALAADESQRRIAPTQTLPREDPSCGDAVRTANEQAYAADAKRLRGPY